MTAEKLLEHQGAILLAQSDGCAVWQFRNETGDGMMTTYETVSYTHLTLPTNSLV